MFSLFSAKRRTSDKDLPVSEIYLKKSHYDCTNIEKLSCENRAANKINTPPERISFHCVINSVVGSGKKSKDYFWGDYHFKEVNQPYLKKL